ncbi:MAG: LysR family transcriptional regulator [Betaproteobacteria bacterium]|nr:LysR family transcriptional regulator [Betaproteobacteria bacterium]MBI3057409.1 LysR family transcriptional regulator [Betaproteobacteria bacterium]
MELRDIEYFAVVAEHRNLGRAAAALELSPTALSKSLRRLEKSLQAKLVNRTAKGVELTIEGDALLTRVRGLRLFLADVAREVSDLAQGRLGRLHIGAGPSAIVERLLAGAHAALMKTSSKVTMVIRVDQTDVTLPALRAGELDLVISGLPAQPDGDLVHEPLVDDDTVVIASAAHPLAKKKRLTIQDLAGERWVLSPADAVIRRRFDQLFEARGIAPPVPAVEVSSAVLKLRMAATSGLLSFQSAWWLYDPPPGLELVRIPVTEMTLCRRIGVSYRKGAYLSPAARKFIELLKMAAKEMTAGKQSM